ncbi:fucose mutarotase-like [Pollicipes pollicipes]|uniref:fucose mutarotase-like n=1 Tax=Pollicipes pollicipes TaxID=41117 RepID=UPI001884DF54|nr:fucose mutarotase-like [Pollicipes pollicipes]XP_037071476.1 fucose mutarotase-like [Pollicipes pollicipes]XP_037071477.1 fucose mutarotase-like [Pollicipes pollicipes]XP_037071482.1 fucose mutarotase-like [Pollicipes pollicipes]XP_037071483.1 fucose mutarotase-like [Pollicipes pollicipes]XP_037071484.1 fucose mutarotase-like [Pollicipes pollicipes]XP_037071485.1 fucose mutarotase-like [Pollicipes pollicipes]
MLKNIPSNLSPDLLHVLASMGHGDELVLADANFPTSSTCRAGPREVRADGQTIPQLLESLLQLLPLDSYVPQPVALMDMVPEDKAAGLQAPVWEEYRRLLALSEGAPVGVELVERFAFYERAKRSFAVVHTGERSLYGNIILKKGVIKQA